MNSNSKLYNIKTSKIYAYILPGFIVFVFAIIVPILICIYISLTSWKGGPVINYVGLKNYLILFRDKTFWEAFLHNLEFIGILLISQIGLALIFSIFIQNKLVKLKELHRRIIFLPSILTPLVVGFIWRFVYNSNHGLIAGVMKAVGLGDYIIPWLDSSNLIILSISIVLTWQYVGQFVIIIMAGMQNISPSILEAAEIDGASSFQRTFHIILPLLKSTLSVCVLLCISGCMKMFALVFAISGGGPGTASQITAIYAYNMTFRVMKLGYSSAISIGMVLLSLALIALFQVIMRLFGGRENV